MNNINSRIYAALPVTVLADIPKELKITQDGIMDIFPIQWTDVDIPFVITVSGVNCNSYMPYVQADFTIDSGLNSFCVTLTTNGIVDSFAGTENYCDGGVGYYKGTFMIPSSALPDSEENFHYEECDPETPIRDRTRRVAINARISASATVTLPDTSTVEITGQSAEFRVIKNENFYDFRKINENRKITDFVEEYGLQQWEIHGSTTNFVGNYLYNMLGGNNPSQYNTNIHEQIQNYFSNNYDIETCSIKALQSQAQMIGETIEYVAPDMPSELNRVFEFAAISPMRIFGHNVDNFAATITGPMTLNNIENLIGDPINLNSVITEPQYIFYQKTGLDWYNFLYLSETDVGKTYKTVLTDYLTKNEDFGIDNVCVYSALTVSPTITNSLLDYNNSDNKLDYTKYEDWTSDDGIMLELLYYVLQKNLQ